MNPVIILIPALGLMFGPRLWVNHVLKQHNRRDEDFSSTAGDLARELLDEHRLQAVRVEATDLGDHYDPQAKAVRVSRDKIDRKTLTAVTTAAHEVAHALQDASGYGPFLWRTRLVKVAQITGEVGTVMLIAAPAVALATRHPIPPIVIGSAALAMLGTGVAAQLAALPSELDASFRRALPMLREAYISDEQLKDARRILLACSFTYVASSLVAILHIWPWLGRRPMYLTRGKIGPMTRLSAGPVRKNTASEGRPLRCAANRKTRLKMRKCNGIAEELIRCIGKPLIRGWFQVSGLV
ncbi:MAG: zinc metallopeptidase [Pseudomonadota bacterium]|nr:zinc metallopeptidase [Pseudomonadota bacterium]